MKIVIILPPSNIKTEFLSVQYPINAGYVASYLIKNGFEVEIWDYTIEPYSEEKFIERIKESSPTIVGFSCMTPTIINGGHMAGLVKKVVSTEILTVVGGPHSTAMPLRTLEEFPDFEVVVIGEGEETMLEVSERVSKGETLDKTRGIAHRTGVEIIIEDVRPLIKDLDSIPFPARDLVSPDLYERSQSNRAISRKFLNISEFICSRGCPNRCIFCAGHVGYHGKTRFRSADNIIKEAEECVQKYNTNHITIMDDTFTLNRKLVSQVCDGFKKLGVSWDCNTRVDAVSLEMLKKMVDCGCKKISFGVESGSPRILKLIRKGITVEQVRQAFKWAHEVGLDVIEATFMVGSHPSETRDDIKMSENLIKDIQPDVLSLTVITPYPGTEVYEIMKGRGYLQEENWSNFVVFGKAPAWRTEHFASDELVKIQKAMLRKFYLDPRYILRRMKKIKSLSEFKYWSDAGIDFLKHVVINRQ